MIITAKNPGGGVQNNKVYLPEDIKKYCANPIFIISIGNIDKHAEVIEQLQSLYDCNCLEYYISQDIYYKIESAYSKKIYDKLYIVNDKLQYYKPEESTKLFMKNITLYITERCTLKCKDCSTLVQYFDKPVDCNTNVILNDIDLINIYFDKLRILTLLGGEPFMHKDIYDIITYAQLKSNIELVSIVTNATIPPDIEKLKNLNTENIQILLSDYGVLSKEMKNWIRVLDELGIAYWVRDNIEWLDCGKIVDYNRSKQDLIKIYNTCCVRENCIYVRDEKVFICAHAIGLYLLEAMPKDEIEYIDITYNKELHEIIKQEIKNMIYKSTQHKVCNYCNGRTIGVTEKVTPAIQIKKPLSYKKY